ncbi:MAG: hypothetical protein L0027_04210 [Candidatus Rokubacteria bacterium]|nr:hypothetical protein [Candidatus Rokubacteria bacterium]
MPRPVDGPFKPQKSLSSKTAKKVYGSGDAESQGIIEVTDELPKSGHIRLGILIQKKQAIKRFRYRSNNYDVLREAHHPEVEKDLNDHLLRPWDKDLKFVGFRIPVDKIDDTVASAIRGTRDAKTKVDIDFKLAKVSLREPQDLWIVFNNDDSFKDGHYNYGVSTIGGGSRRSATAPRRPAKTARRPARRARPRRAR